MKPLRLYLILFLIGCCATQLHAQSSDEKYRSIYQQAESEYEIGRIEQARDLLTDNLKGFTGTLRQSVFRLLSLCALGTDDNVAAEQHVRELLNENPYYSTTASDPQRFIDMVENIKSGLAATITTASSQAESLSEVPVPTTLITSEMIRDCGASNLQGVLAAYVPGMNIVDCNDDINIAMRGVYSNSQEKILIMLNGHRLNSYCTNIAAPDYSISLEKIKQIEILRGPASSLYGGVSLTAVVNIITWQGADMDGLKVKAGIGNYGQIRGDMLFGKRHFDLDFLVWGGIYRSKGEKRRVEKEDTGMNLYGGNALIGCVGNKPSYDAGLALKYKGLEFLYNTSSSQIASPLTMHFLFSPYNIDLYKTFNGLRPGYTTISHHADLSYGRQLGNMWLKASVAYDNSDLTHYQVISEQAIEGLSGLLMLPDTLASVIEGKDGIFRYINGQEHTIGAKLQGDWKYLDNRHHKGLLTFGAEYSYFDLEDVRYTFGYEHVKLINESDVISRIGKGHESNINTYIQLKHQWRSFILNAGLRFDFKNRYDNSKIRELSPRAALIYMRPKWNVKLSYSKSFIDAPYLYRKTNEVLYSLIGFKNIPSTLDPESLHSWQLTFNAVNWLPGLNFEVNGFYNRAHDLIYMLIGQHNNAGDMDNYGIEFSGSWQSRRFSAHLNTTWQQVRKNNIFGWDLDRHVNTPSFMANAVLAWTPIRNLRLHSHLSFYSKQQTFYLNVMAYSAYMEALSRYFELYYQYEIDPSSVSLEEMNEVSAQMSYYDDRATSRSDYPARLIVNLGASYTIGRLELGFDIHNLLNTHYSQSGMSTGLIPQKGLWFMATASYKF